MFQFLTAPLAKSLLSPKIILISVITIAIGWLSISLAFSKQENKTLTAENRSLTEKLLHWKQATEAMQKENQKLKQVIAADRTRSKAIEDGFRKSQTELSELRRKYEAVNKFVVRCIPDQLNRWLQVRYGQAGRENHREKTADGIPKANACSKVVNDLIVFITKWDRALQSCNKDKALLREYYSTEAASSSIDDISSSLTMIARASRQY